MVRGTTRGTSDRPHGEPRPADASRAGEAAAGDASRSEPAAPDEGRDARRARRQLVVACKQQLRDLRLELAVLNHRVGGRVTLKDLDFDCLDLVVRHGPIGPTALARRMGVHAATMTGILTRLEQGGWVVREDAPDDRRAVLVRALPDRQREVYGHFAGMDSAMDRVCDGFTDEQLAVVIDFLRRTTDAGEQAAADLA